MIPGGMFSVLLLEVWCFLSTHTNPELWQIITVRWIQVGSYYSLFLYFLYLLPHRTPHN